MSKLDVQYMQSGGEFGVFMTPSLVLQPPQDAPASAPSQGKSTKSDSSSELFDGKLLDELYKKGLSNDVKSFISEYQSYYQTYANMDPIMKNSSYGRSILNRLQYLPAKANEILNNRGIFDEAMKHLEKEGVMGDIAINENGYVYVYQSGNKPGTGSLKLVSMNQYAENRDNYHALTYSQLMQYRGNDPSLAYNNSIQHSVQSAIGIDNIVKKVNDLGSAVKSSSYERKFDMPPAYKEALSSEGLSPENLEQILANYSNVDKNKNNHKQLNAAANVVWSILSQGERNTLRAQALADGATNVDAYARNIALQMLAVREETDVREGLKTGSSGSGSGGPKEGDVYPNQASVTGLTGFQKLEFQTRERKNGETVYTPKVISSASNILFDIIEPTSGTEGKVMVQNVADSKGIAGYALNDQLQDAEGNYLDPSGSFAVGKQRVVKLPVKKDGYNITIDQDAIHEYAQLSDAKEIIETKLKETISADEKTELEMELSQLKIRLEKIPTWYFMQTDVVVLENKPWHHNLPGNLFFDHGDDVGEKIKSGLYSDLKENHYASTQFEKYKNTKEGKASIKAWNSVNDHDTEFLTRGYIPLTSKALELLSVLNDNNKAKISRNPDGTAAWDAREMVN